MEYDKACADEYRAAIEKEAGGTLYAGDQADSVLLAEVVADTYTYAYTEAQGRFNIIIDDGGHNPTAQMASLRGLWPALKSGGMYVVKDVQPSYLAADAFKAYTRPQGQHFQLSHCQPDLNMQMMHAVAHPCICRLSWQGSSLN